MPLNNGTPSGSLFVQTNSVTVGNTVSELTLLGTGQGSLTLGANFFRAGKSFRIWARGVISDTGTPTLRIRVKLGATTILDTTAVTLAGTLSNNEWEMNCLVTCRTVGVSGTVFAQGHFQEFPNNRLGMPNTTTSTIDTTASQVINITALWGTADPANTMTCTNVMIEGFDGAI